MSRDGTYLDYHARDPTDLLVPPSSFLGRNMREILPPDLAIRFEEAFAQASEDPVLVDTCFPRWRGPALRGAVGAMRTDEILSIVRDVSAQKLADDELAGALEHRARSERVAALEGLAATVAHEVKQPLSAILTNAQACIRYLSDPSRNLPRIQDALRDVVAEAIRATNVVDRTRDLFRGREPLVTESLVIRQTIDTVLHSVRSRLQRAAIEVRVVLEPGLPSALGAEAQVQQVLVIWC